MIPQPSSADPLQAKLGVPRRSSRGSRGSFALDQIRKQSQGLKSVDVEEIRTVCGYNRLSPPKTVPDYILFLQQFLNMFMLLLSAAAILSLIAYFINTSTEMNLYLAILLFVVVFRTCTATFLQERSTGKAMDSFKNMLPAQTFVMASILFILGVIHKNGKDVLITFVDGFLVILVANVPQGLHVTVTSLLTITAGRLAAKNVFVKRLDCVETLGSISLIATDKTGTLTKNVMTVTDIWTGPIMDPPRDDVPDAIAKCKAAGIKVFMVTGDHPLTGRAIATEIGLLDDNGRVLDLLEPRSTKEAVKLPVDFDTYTGAVVHGGFVNLLSNEDLKAILRLKSVVFARTTPQHKLQIVKASQEIGECVGVTGDGINDAPTLKQADVGVAMGKNGSDVARQAADIILMDDNFSSIVRGVEQGRIIFDNVKKTIAYTIDLGTELGPAVSIAHEGGEHDIMQRPPRNVKKDRFISKSLLVYSYIVAGMINAGGCLLAYGAVFWRHDVSFSDLFMSAEDNWIKNAEPMCITDTKCLDAQDQMRILAEACASWYVALVVCQFFHIWMVKTRRTSVIKAGIFKNIVTVYGGAMEILIVVLVVYVPGIQLSRDDKFLAKNPASLNG
ncbi:hypothetical protein JG688_00014673 [Phytophthora aleatoria]|uniref:Cation-transporting P-type ATPase N-terminal domain-containing protein n=1 Tax=Phytophthora aleatoria TaxID=2496075 RepID=A0A8J5IBI8_9STRA|nr:hypothetical protein JG688_00014673 [Phytophthora aleatoria]